MRSTHLLSLVLGLAVAGCHDHGVPGNDMAVGHDMAVGGGEDMAVADMALPPDARQYVTFTQFAMDYAQTLCAHYMACGRVDAAQLNACVERNLRHTGWDQDTEIMKGRMELNELQCLDAVKNSRCDGTDDAAWVGKCVQFLYQANQPKGSPCVAAEECQTGFCQRAGSDAGMTEQPEGCPGTCADQKPPGSACRLPTDCTPDSICPQGGPMMHVCVQQAALSQSCTNALGNGSGPGCQYGLMCPTFPTGAPTCTVPMMQTTLHMPCDPMLGLYTPTPPCSNDQYCRLAYTQSATACTGQPFQCYPGYCDTTAGKCMMPTGATCETKIASGTMCDPNNLGFASFAANQCADGSTCLKLPGQANYSCQPLVSASGVCGGDGDCKIGMNCVSGHCTPWFTDGQSCGMTGSTTPTMCPQQQQGGPNVCIIDNPDAGTTYTCQTIRSFGGACIPGSEDGLCAAADLPGTSACVPTTGGMGACAPKCY